MSIQLFCPLCGCDNVKPVGVYFQCKSPGGCGYVGEKKSFITAFDAEARMTKDGAVLRPDLACPECQNNDVVKKGHLCTCRKCGFMGYQPSFFRLEDRS